MGKCNCSCKGAVSTEGKKGNPGANGTNGTNGTNGVDGLYGGWSSMWKYEKSTGDHPGVKTIRLENGTPQLVNYIYVNINNAYGLDIPDFLASFDNTGNFGWIRLFVEHDSSKFSYYKMTSIDTTLYGSTVVKIGVTWVDGTSALSSPFSDDDNVVMTFTPAFAVVADGKSTVAVTILLDGIDTLISGSSTAALAAGTYLFWGTANIGIAGGALEGAEVSCQFNVNASPVGSASVVEFLSGAAAQSVKMSASLLEKITVTAGQVVSIHATAALAGGGAAIAISQSVQYIKIG